MKAPPAGCVLRLRRHRWTTDTSSDGNWRPGPAQSGASIGLGHRMFSVGTPPEGCALADGHRSPRAATFVHSVDAAIAKAQVSTSVVKSPVVPCEVRLMRAMASPLYAHKTGVNGIHRKMVPLAQPLKGTLATTSPSESSTISKVAASASGSPQPHGRAIFPRPPCERRRSPHRGSEIRGLADPFRGRRPNGH